MGWGLFWWVGAPRPDSCPTPIQPKQNKTNQTHDQQEAYQVLRSKVQELLLATASGSNISSSSGGAVTLGPDLLHTLLFVLRSNEVSACVRALGVWVGVLHSDFWGLCVTKRAAKLTPSPTHTHLNQPGVHKQPQGHVDADQDAQEDAPGGKRGAGAAAPRGRGERRLDRPGGAAPAGAGPPGGAAAAAAAVHGGGADAPEGGGADRAQHRPDGRAG